MATKKQPQPSPLPPQAVSSSLRPIVVDTRAVWLVLGLLALLAVLYAVRGVAITVVFVAVVTFLCEPLVVRLERRGLGRSAGAAVVIGGLVVVVLGLAALVLPALIADLSQLIGRWPELLQSASTFVERLTGFVIPTSVKELSGAAGAALFEQLSPVAASGGALVGQGALSIARAAASLVGSFGEGVLVVVFSYFVLAEWPAVRTLLATNAPTSWRAPAAHYLPLVEEALSALVVGQLTVAAIMACIYAVGLWIAGVPAALAIAVLSGAAYIIPFASVTTCMLLSTAFALLELGTQALWPIVGAGVLCAVIQVIEGYLLTPRIVGEKAGLSPLATLTAVLLGGSSGGFLGVLFALPIGAVVALVLRERSRSIGVEVAA